MDQIIKANRIVGTLYVYTYVIIFDFQIKCNSNRSVEGS